MASLTDYAKKLVGTAASYNPIANAAYAVTGGKTGTDLTPGYSVGNVIATQANNLFGGSQPQAAPAGGNNDQAAKDAAASAAADAEAKKNAGAYPGDGGAAGANKAADLAYIDDQTGQLRDFLTRTGGKLDNGLTQLGYDYNKVIGDANENKARTDLELANREEDTTKAKDAALDRTRTKSRNLANSVRNIIGRASGNSSALEVGGKAVIDQATDEATDLNTTFGRNFRDLAMTKDQNQSSYDKLVRNANDERKSKESALREGVMTAQQQTEGQLADLARQKAAAQGGGYSAIRAASAPLQSSISNRQADIDKLFSQFASPYTSTMAKINAPTLADYTADPAKVQATQQAAPGAAQVLAPWLKNPDEQLAY